MKPSFDKINYLLRPNKNIERKLIVEALTEIKEPFEISDYSYIGMGSMWFVDFILVHKILNIQKMFSIERAEYEKRADFNKPYDCIKIVPGETTKVLPDMSALRQKAVIWLDHDTGLANGPALEDTRIVCEKAPIGSIFILTVNADHDKIKGKKGKYTRLDALRRLAGDFVPINTKDSDIRVGTYPILLAKIIFSRIKSALKKSGRREEFYPLFNILYADGAPMITISGMFVDDDYKRRLIDCRLSDKFDYIKGETPFVINVPHLTIKEKIELDRILPREKAPTSDEMEKLGLRDDQLKSYHELYRYYPMFGEFYL